MRARSEDSARLPMRDGLFSIITPAYRCANVVGRTIQSVLDQTYPDWELLIAEDCSPDSTREEIERWTRVDPRINLIKMERNGGPAAARNAALKQAQGRWIAFLDSDDLRSEEHTSELQSLMRISYAVFCM